MTQPRVFRCRYGAISIALCCILVVYAGCDPAMSKIATTTTTQTQRTSNTSQVPTNVLHKTIPTQSSARYIIAFYNYELVTKHVKYVMRRIRQSIRHITARNTAVCRREQTPLPSSGSGSGSPSTVSDASSSDVSTDTWLWKHIHTAQDSQSPVCGVDQRKHAKINTGWKVINRENAASSYPTDFVLVEASASHPKIPSRLAIVRALENDSAIKYVVADQSVHQLLTIDEPESKKTSESVDATATYQAEPAMCDVHDVGSFVRPSRFRTFGTFPEEDPYDTANILGRTSAAGRRLSASSRRLLGSAYSITDDLSAPVIWERGFSGKDIKVGVFDTGLREDHPHFRNVEERTNWTNEKSLNDGLGHGTFVAGVIAGQFECLGFAPDAHLYIFRVFTNQQISYTSWFLDAFNYAIYTNIDVLNLSIGGPDFLDRPFVDKVLEMSANNIIVVSAIGNDGPLYGTLNNPADHMDVIGVGGITRHDTIAPFSSRGMTTWELPAGYGRMKPDIVTLSKDIRGSRIQGGCRSLSGTSVASPVVAGVVTLLASTIPDAARRHQLINPASMKQALAASASPIPNANIFEQGMGKLNLLGAHEFLKNYKPHASVLPPSLHLTECPYMWPFCSQPMYFDSIPQVFNLTILNGMSVSGRLAKAPHWELDANAPLSATNLLDLEFEYAQVLWPWSSYLAVRFHVLRPAKQEVIVKGTISLSIVSDSAVTSDITIPVSARVVPSPPRSKRLLWDQFHNLRYPSGYFPRDNLDVKTDVLDWNGDHLHTNFKEVWTVLRNAGYFIEILGRDFSCFDARKYSTLLIVDPEEEYFPEEINKLHNDIHEHGLSVLVIAEWYNIPTMQKIKFFDDNTSRWWTPLTGGSNVPALNDLLRPYGIAFTDRIWKGGVQLGSYSTQYLSGTSLGKFPSGGILVHADLTEIAAGSQSSGRRTTESAMPIGTQLHKQRVPILGLMSVTGDVVTPLVGDIAAGHMNHGTNGNTNTNTNTNANINTKHNHNRNHNIHTEAVYRNVAPATSPGRIAVYGDSNCLDMNHRKTPACTWLLLHMLEFTCQGKLDEQVFSMSDKLLQDFTDGHSSPARLEPHMFARYSHVKKPGARPQCMMPRRGADSSSPDSQKGDDNGDLSTNDPAQMKNNNLPPGLSTTEVLKHEQAHVQSGAHMHQHSRSRDENNSGSSTFSGSSSSQDSSPEIFADESSLPSSSVAEPTPTPVPKPKPTPTPTTASSSFFDGNVFSKLGISWVTLAAAMTGVVLLVIVVRRRRRSLPASSAAPLQRYTRSGFSQLGTGSTGTSLA
jgi:subtilisin family serine protease